MKFYGTFRLGLWIMLAIVVGFCTGVANSAPQNGNRNELQLRTVHGIVVDKAENPAPSSIVYLMNEKSQTVKTYIADSGGNYRFSGLDPNVDYEIHAEKGNMVSPVRIVSSFDSRRDIMLVLTLSHYKKAHS